MGLLGFTKRSRKQDKNNQKSSNQAFSFSSHLPSQDNDDNRLTFPTSSRDFDIVNQDSCPKKEPETSLMDDIMNELDSDKSSKRDTYQNPSTNLTKLSSNKKVTKPLLSFDSTSNNVIPSFAHEVTNISPAVITSEQQHQQVASGHMQKQRQRPLMNLPSNNNLYMQRDMMLANTKDADSHFSDTDNEPIIATKISMRQPVNKLSTTDPIHSVKSITPPPIAPIPSSSNHHIKSSPPASSVATSHPATDLMYRMKERHRQEVRRSINNSPFLETHQTSFRKNLSSPSMPVIYSTDNTSSSFPLNNHASTRPLMKPLVQSQSLHHMHMPITKRAPNHLVKSVSTVNNIYGNSEMNYGTIPIQPLSASGPRNSVPPLMNRLSYLQTTGNNSNILEEKEEVIEEEEKTIINRSMSSYSNNFSSNVFLIQQQQIQQKIQQQQYQEKIQQQIQQQIEQQKMQQHIEQERIQVQLDQNQIKLEEQQRAQQYQLHQLKIQHQNQQYLNQVISNVTHKIKKTTLENTMTKKMSLHQRTPSPTTVIEENYPNSIVSPDTPPPESQTYPSIADSSSYFLNENAVIKLPAKLKRELQSMQLSKSPYSVPDLSAFTQSNEEDDEEEEEEELIVDEVLLKEEKVMNWNTIQLFSSPTQPLAEQVVLLDTTVPNIIIKCCSPGTDENKCLHSKKVCSKHKHHHHHRKSCNANKDHRKHHHHHHHCHNNNQEQV